MESLSTNLQEENKNTPERQEKIIKIIDDFSCYCRYLESDLNRDDSILIQNDPTLLFANSTMSKHKDLIARKDIPEKGLGIIQKCLRTQDLVRYLDSEFEINYPALFTMIGMLVPNNENTHKNLIVSTCLLLQKLGISLDRIQIKNSSQNTILNQSLYIPEGISCVVDSEKESYYKWNYGRDDFTGEGLTIAIQQKDKTYKDIGNVICFVDSLGSSLGYETAFGVETLIARRDSMVPYQAHILPDLLKKDEIQNRDVVYADVLRTTVELLKEGVVPSAKKEGYIVKKYIQTLYYLNKNQNADLMKDCFYAYTDIFKIKEKDILFLNILKYIENIELSKKKSIQAFLKNTRHMNLSDINKNILAKESYGLLEEDFSQEIV